MASVIRGLVDPAGSGGASSGDGMWSLVFSLAAVRNSTGSILMDARRCEMPVPEDELPEYRALAPAFAIVSLEVESESSELLKIISISPSEVQDEELTKLANELKKPVHYTHHSLGRFEYDRRVGWFSGKSSWGKDQTLLYVVARNPNAGERIFELPSRVLAAQARWDGLIREALAHYLIPLKNQSWLQWWEFKLTEQRLMRRIALRTIQFDETGRITFWFSDGGLFLGHDIEVRAYEERGVSEVCLAG